MPVRFQHGRCVDGQLSDPRRWARKSTGLSDKRARLLRFTLVVKVERAAGCLCEMSRSRFIFCQGQAYAGLVVPGVGDWDTVDALACFAKVGLLSCDRYFSFRRTHGSVYCVRENTGHVVSNTSATPQP